MEKLKLSFSLCRRNDESGFLRRANHAAGAIYLSYPAALANVAYRDLFVFSACGTAPRAPDDVTRPAHKLFW